MTDAKTSAIEAAKAKAVGVAALTGASLTGPDGKLTPLGMVLALGGGIGALIGGVEDVYYTDKRGVVRCARHILSIFKARSYSMTEEVNDDDRPVMDLTGEIDKIVGERIYDEESKRLDEEWRQRKMRSTFPESEWKHMPAPSGDGRTLCGDVLEGDPAIDLPVPVVSKKHEPITCERCLKIIRACRDVAPWRVV